MKKKETNLKPVAKNKDGLISPFIYIDSKMEKPDENGNIKLSYNNLILDEANDYKTIYPNSFEEKIYNFVETLDYYESLGKQGIDNNIYDQLYFNINAIDKYLKNTLCNKIKFIISQYLFNSFSLIRDKIYTKFGKDIKLNYKEAYIALINNIHLPIYFKKDIDNYTLENIASNFATEYAQFLYNYIQVEISDIAFNTYLTIDEINEIMGYLYDTFVVLRDGIFDITISELKLFFKPINDIRYININNLDNIYNSIYNDKNANDIDDL